MKANLRFAPALALVAMLGAAPAFAADVVEQVPEPGVPMEVPPVASWEGAYAGVSLGYGFAGETRGATGGTIGTSGFVGHGFAGYNFQTDLFVYGLEGDLGYGGYNGTNGTTNSQSGLDGSLRARMGVAVTDSVLVYATGGGAGQRLTVTDAAGSASNNMFGWTAGAGADVKLTDNVFGRVEYRYTDFGSKTFNTGSGAQNIDSRDNRITLGIGMKF